MSSTKYQEYLSRLLAVMIKNAASDLFLTSHFPPAIKRDGELLPLGTQLLSPSDVMQFAEAMTTEQQRAQFAASHELNFAYESGTSSRFRVNIMRQKGREAIVLRRIPNKIATIADLDLPPILEKIDDAVKCLVGIVGMQCGQAKVAGFGKRDGMLHRFHIADLAN